MITVVIGSETWRRKHGWVFSLSCLSLSFFGLLFNQLDWSTCFSKLSQRCNIHFAEVKSTVHTLLDSVVYKWFCVDLKVVGIFYLGAFLITNGSCVMMPIMSVVQQGGCNPSCRLMLEQQRIYTTGFCLWWFAVSHTTYLCLFAGLWSCCPFKWVVWVPWSGWFCPLLSHLLAWLLFFLAFCQRSQDFRWNDAVTKRARQRLPDMPSQVFVFWGPPSLPPPPLIPSTPPPPPPDPWEQEVYLVKWWMGPLLLLGGKKKSLSFPPGQSDEFSSLKAEGRLCFFGSVLERSEPECLEATGTSPLCVRRELIADKVQSGVFALGKWIGN